jgi:hypothetical protein
VQEAQAQANGGGTGEDSLPEEQGGDEAGQRDGDEPEEPRPEAAAERDAA